MAFLNHDHKRSPLKHRSTFRIKDIPEKVFVNTDLKLCCCIKYELRGMDTE